MSNRRGEQIKPVASLQEFFKDSVHDAMQRNRVRADDLHGRAAQPAVARETRLHLAGRRELFAIAVQAPVVVGRNVTAERFGGARDARNAALEAQMVQEER